jgi:hypothetical protein
MLSTKKLHIVSFDNPYPPNYGGVIDVFYKLKSIHSAGVKIILHAFEYGRKPTKELNKYCDKVYYYQRRNFVNPFIGSLPYIVNTRNSNELLENLMLDNAPILFEGLHTCFFLNHPALAKRKKIVRMHNIEHEYYENLEAIERNFFKKYFFSKESIRLKVFEHILHHAQLILAISPNDKDTLSKQFSNVHYIPAFHCNEEITSLPGKGKYILYHGRLSVGENDEAARYLIEQVFSNLKLPFYIAGDKPSPLLKAAAERYPHIKLFDHLSTDQISELISQAHINVLPTFQNTGIKLKLINVLYQGRFVIANDMMVKNTGLENLCTVANTAISIIEQIEKLMEEEFSMNFLQERKMQLTKKFNNHSNVTLLLTLLD